MGEIIQPIAGGAGAATAANQTDQISQIDPNGGTPSVFKQLSGSSVFNDEVDQNTSSVFQNLDSNSARSSVFKEEKLRMELEDSSRQSTGARLAEKLLENDSLILALTGLLTKFAGNQTHTQTTQIAQAPAQAPAEIAATLQRLSVVDPDYLNTLEKMTTYLENNPGVINQIKPIFNA